MDHSEPRVRHRGCFATTAEGSDPDLDDEAAAEGVTVRVRLIRPRIKRRAPGLLRRAAPRSPRVEARALAIRRHAS